MRVDVPAYLPHPVENREQLEGLAHGTVPRRPPRALGAFLRAPIGFLEAGDNLTLPRLANGLGAVHDPPDGPVPCLEVLCEGEPGPEDSLTQTPELGVLRVPQREPDASPSERRCELGLARALTLQEPRDIVGRHGVETNRLRAGEDSGQHRLAGGRQQDKYRLALGFFERLEERVCRLYVEGIRLQDEDPARTLEGPARRETHRPPRLPDGRERPLRQDLLQVWMQT